MSQISKHVDWCIKKAIKEIEECKKLGKRIKHRGLVKIKPDMEEAKKHIKKAEHNLNAVSKFMETEFSDWSITAGFYCIYHCFLAIAFKFGYESRNQDCTVSLIEHLKEENKINIEQKFIDMIKHEDIKERQENNVIEMREDYTYGIEISIEDKTKIKDLIKNCKDMIDIAKNIIFEQRG